MPYRVLQLTDFHLLRDRAGRLRDVPTWETLADVLTVVRSRYSDCAWIVVTGDIADDERPETYRMLRPFLGDLTERMVFIPGNHDSRPALREIFGTASPAGDGSIGFDVPAGDWRLIGLDSHVPGEVAGRVSSGQLTWLKAALERQVDRPVIVFVHHPPIPVGSPWIDAIGLDDAEPLVAVLRQAPRVRAVACGHVHQEFSGTLPGAAVVCCPATSFQFTPGTEDPIPHLVPPGFRVFELKGTDFTTRVERLQELRFPPAGN